MKFQPYFPNQSHLIAQFIWLFWNNFADFAYVGGA